MIEQVISPKETVCHSEGMFDGRSPARHRHIRQVSETLVVGLIRDENFSTPDRPIGTIARAVEGDAATRAKQPMLAEH